MFQIAMSSDVVAHWNVPLNDGVHRIEFEHGTTTGKRVIRVDGNVIMKRDWMFKLVGNEYFTVGNAKCVIRVNLLIILISFLTKTTNDVE